MITIFTRRPKRRPFFPMNGALTGFDYTNSAWTVSSGRALCTPTLGAELLTNGTFDSDTAWTKGTNWTIGSGVASHTGATASNITQAVATVGNWYRLAFDITATSGTGVIGYFGTSGANTGLSRTFLTTGSKLSARRQVSTTAIGPRAIANEICSIDNASAKLLTHSDLFASKDFSKTTATITVNLITEFTMPCGIVGWLDSYTSPANYITAYTIGNRIFLDKVVAGTPTNLITSSAVGAESGYLILTGTRSGANLLLDCYINGASIGTQQTVSDAEIVSNTRHGMFSTDPTAKIKSFSIR